MAMGICLPAKLRRQLGGVLALCMVASQSPAGAANASEGIAKNGDRDAKQEAKARFVSGQSHYNLNEFGEALGDFKEAYRLLPDPVFLYNLGQCERQLGHLEEAIRFYRSFLREQPKAANRQEVARKIDEMEATLRSKPAEADKSASPLAETDALASAAGASQEATPGLAPTDRNRTATPTAISEPALSHPVASPDQPNGIPSSETVHSPVSIPLAASPAGADNANNGLARIDLTATPSAPAASASPAFYSHWWFWPAAGVLAAGAGLGIYAATANRSPAAPNSALGSKKVF
jgi:tetratricopeptide (TPR) repeat protein